MPDSTRTVKADRKSHNPGGPALIESADLLLSGNVFECTSIGSP